MKKIFMLCVVATVVLLCMPMQRAIVFTETKTTTPQTYMLPINDGDSFAIRYTHSIHLSDVEEHYTIEENRIRVRYMTYSDTAIGMPGAAEEGQTLTFQDGVYTLTFQERYLDEFTLYVGDIDLDLTLLYDERAIALKDVLTRGKSYRIDVQKQSIYERIKGVTIR